MAGTCPQKPRCDSPIPYEYQTRHAEDTLQVGSEEASDDLIFTVVRTTPRSRDSRNCIALEASCHAGEDGKAVNQALAVTVPQPTSHGVDQDKDLITIVARVHGFIVTENAFPLLKKLKVMVTSITDVVGRRVLQSIIHRHQEKAYRPVRGLQTHMEKWAEIWQEFYEHGFFVMEVSMWGNTIAFSIGQEPQLPDCWIHLGQRNANTATIMDWLDKVGQDDLEEVPVDNITEYQHNRLYYTQGGIQIHTRDGRSLFTMPPSIQNRLAQVSNSLLVSGILSHSGGDGKRSSTEAPQAMPPPSVPSPIVTMWASHLRRGGTRYEESKITAPFDTMGESSTAVIPAVGATGFSRCSGAGVPGAVGYIDAQRALPPPSTLRPAQEAVASHMADRGQLEGALNPAGGQTSNAAVNVMLDIAKAKY